ncbi:hypothetical protein LWM68_13310 [Niabella sp. W65]|nr:hypothetical protein [Niabella sp. W65]MCH7363640.1 hypothetical protein [Niabella sp. W65]
MALQVTPLIRKPVLVPYHLQFDYTQMNDIMTAVKQFDCEVLKQELQLFCIMDIAIPQYRLTETLMKLGDIRDISIQPIQK